MARDGGNDGVETGIPRGPATETEPENVVEADGRGNTPREDARGKAKAEHEVEWGRPGNTRAGSSTDVHLDDVEACKGFVEKRGRSGGPDVLNDAKEAVKLAGSMSQGVQYVYDLDSKDESDSRMRGLPWSMGMPEGEKKGAEEDIDYGTLDLLLKARLMAEGDSASTSTDVDGRLGPPQVKVDRGSSSGDLLWDSARLRIESRSNFSSARANVCVYKGKWMYEVTLGNCGIQQIGWATLDCPFTFEEGVGDAPDSYAYDGKRVRKWNVSCHSYGQTWATGDVIGCCMDLERGEISFLRNGESLGVAFTDVRRWREGLAYFPAFSLSQGEKAELNFGGRAFLYPVPGFRPLQEPAAEQAAQADYLLGCLRRLMQLSSTAYGQTSLLPINFAYQEFDASDVVLSCALVAKYLCPLLKVDFVVSAVLIPFLLNISSPLEDLSNVPQFASMFFPVLEQFEILEVVSKLFDSLASLYRTSPFTSTVGCTPPGYRYLKLALELMRIPEVFVAWRARPSFYSQFEMFLTQKQPNPNDLNSLLPEVWWPGADCKFSSEDAMKTQCRNIKRALGIIEGVQFEMCMELLTCPSTRESTHFEEFVLWLIQKNKGANRNVPPPNLSDPTVLNSTFFVLLRVLHYHVRIESKSVDALERFPASIFVTELARELDLPRLGGTLAHVEREHPLKCLQHLNVEIPPGARHLEGDDATSSMKKHPLDLKVKPLRQAESLSPEQLTRLFDATLLLYHLSVADAFKAANTQHQAKLHFLSQLEDTERRMQRLDMKSGEMLAHLKEARKRFRKEVIESTRACCWSRMYLFRQQKQCAMYCVSNYACRLMLSLSSGKCSGTSEEGERLFSYVPEYYVDSMVDIFHALRRAEPAFAGASVLARHGLADAISFLVKHFADKRILNPDVRDGLLQSISVLLQYKEYHASFEENEEAREHMIPSLLAAFQERFWIPISNILVHLCRGRGFATKSNKGRDFQSEVFQKILHDTCKDDIEMFSSFLNRLFNTLNWTITEFGVSLKEIKEGARRRQLAEHHQQQRKCTIMFELSVNLLRILEFFSLVLPEVFIYGSGLNLTRLCELIRFVLVHTAAGPEGRSFEERVSHISNLYSQEKLTRGTVLAPVAGTLINLYRAEVEARANGSSHNSVLACLSASDAVVESMDVLENMHWSKALSAEPQSLMNIRFLSELARALREQKERERTACTKVEEDMDADEDTCTICYSATVDTSFLPCGHRSCHQCISRHLLNNKRCFFCNKDVESLDML